MRCSIDEVTQLLERFGSGDSMSWGIAEQGTRGAKALAGIDDHSVLCCDPMRSLLPDLGLVNRRPLDWIYIGLRSFDFTRFQHLPVARETACCNAIWDDWVVPDRGSKQGSTDKVEGTGWII